MIAWYIHHQGSGHTHRAMAIAAQLSVPVVALSSRAEPSGWPGRWVRLPVDDDADADGDGFGQRDVTAGSTLHWVPLHHRGLRERMATISGVLGSGDVRVLVSDVSVEVALLARLHGIPVVMMAQPGDRDDGTHGLAYDQAVRLLAPWPQHPARPRPGRWADKTLHVGGFSRYDGRPRSAVTGSRGRRVLVLWGSGGVDVTGSQVEAAAAATPEWTWQVAGSALPGGEARRPPNLSVLGWTDDVWPLLCSADVVVTHAGQNAVAEVAAARRPAVVIPQRRPFDEQLATAEALQRDGVAHVERRWPDASGWAGALEAALWIGGRRWDRWSAGDGARRAARELEALAGVPVPG